MSVEVWEDENGDAYVSGTTDFREATKALREYYDLNIPEDSPCKFTVNSDTNLSWWNPRVFVEEVEWVSSDDISEEEIPKWVPVFNLTPW